MFGRCYSVSWFLAKLWNDVTFKESPKNFSYSSFFAERMDTFHITHCKQFISYSCQNYGLIIAYEAGIAPARPQWVKNAGCQELGTLCADLPPKASTSLHQFGRLNFHRIFKVSKNLRSYKLENSFFF